MTIKRLLSCILTLAILIGIGSFTTLASGILTIEYSVDGGTTYTQLSGFDALTTEYSVTLADNVSYVILRATVEDGTIAYKVVDVYDAAKYRRGGFRYQPFNGSSQTQYTKERETDNGLIPIKNEIATGKVVYTDALSAETTYSITFKSKQPRITAFTQSSDFTDGNVTFIGGGAVANDNGTILDSSASADRVYALSNVSEALVGSSMFVLPWSNMTSETSTAVTEKDCEFFSFTADTACTVVVMLAQPAAPLSEYAGWTRVNNGTQADDITTFTSPRNKNDYTNTDYFAMAYKWICGDETTNAYRVSSPGINDGELVNNTHVKAGTNLTYAYSKSFAAGKKIRIYNPGCITTNETTALMPVMVNWNNTHAIVEPSGIEISYSYDNETYSSYDLSTYPTDPSKNPNIALPDNTFYVYFNVNIPEGATVELVTSVWPYKNLTGANTTSITYNTGSSNAYKMRQEIAPNSPVPIKSEIIAIRANYTSPLGAYKEYVFEFSCKQPRITGFARPMSTAPYNKVFFESGSAVDNNNRSVLDSNASSGSNRTWALANVSKALQGASLLVLPWEYALRDANDTTTYPKFATFKADTPCTVYVLLDRPADPSSVYANEWTLLNNGTVPARLNTTERYNIPRNVNNFSETDYFAMAYKWMSKTSINLYIEDGVENNNIYRVSNPGIAGSISAGGTHVASFALFSYVYAKELAAGTDLDITNPGSMDPEIETSSLMPVMVKWHIDEPIVTDPGMDIIASDSFNKYNSFEEFTANSDTATTNGGFVTSSTDFITGYEGLGKGNAVSVNYGSSNDFNRLDYYMGSDNERLRNGFTIIKYDYRRGSANNVDFYVGKGNDADLDQNGFEYLSSDEISELSPNDWYHITLCIDLDCQTYSTDISDSSGSSVFNKSGKYLFGEIGFLSWESQTSGSLTQDNATGVDNLLIGKVKLPVLFSANISGNTITTNALIKNYHKNIEKPAKIIIGQYDFDNRLVDLFLSESIAVPAETKTAMSIDYTRNKASDAAFVRAFLWNTTNNGLKPLADRVEIDMLQLSDVKLSGVSYIEFTPDKYNYSNSDYASYPTLTATAYNTDALVTIVQPSSSNGGIGTITVSPAGSNNGKVYTFAFILSEYEVIPAMVTKVKDGKDAIVSFVHDDGSPYTTNYLNREFAKYNLNGTVGIIGTNVATESQVSDWTNFLNNSNGRLNFASHSYNHQYFGVSDDAESGVLSNGTPYNYPAGHMSAEIANERARINGLFPNERILAFIKPGVTAPLGVAQVSDAAMAMIKEHYIAMRNTGGGVDTLPPNDYYSVKSLMGRTTNDYTSENSHSAEYWKDNIAEAINNKGLLVFLFHSILSDAEANNLTTSQSRASIMLKYLGEKVASGEVWSAKFDEAMQYTKQYNAVTKIEARNYVADNRLTVSISDSLSKIDTDIITGKFAGLDMYDYPLTAKVKVPYNWEYVKVTQDYQNRLEIAKTFIENGIRYVYANVVPDKKAANIREATASDYVASISSGGVAVSGFDPAKFHYNISLPYGTSSAPTVSCTNSSAAITQATLSDVGEGSAFVNLGDLKYEIHYSVAKSGPKVLLRIDTSDDDSNYTATKNIVEYLNSLGIKASINNQTAYNALTSSYDVEYCSNFSSDTCKFEFDDTYSSASGDYMVDYKQFAAAYKAASGNSKLLMTIHPEDKHERLYLIFKDQINFLLNNGAEFISSSEY